MVLRSARRQSDVKRSHCGAWRAFTAVPAMIGSAFLLLVLLGWLGTWEGPTLLAWMGCGLLTLTRQGERVAVRVGYGFRPPSAAERSALAPVWSQVLQRCGLPPNRVDLYVQRSGEVNAYAVGSRSVAVTRRVLTDYQAGRINDVLLAPILCHELGHHATRGTRFAPITAWFTLPWRLACGAALRLAVQLAGRQPRGPLAVVVVATVTVAIVQAAQHHAWSNVTVLGSLAFFSIASPATDAALSRASERAADQYAAHVGYGSALAQALHALAGEQVRPGRSRMSVFDRHPATHRRIHDLTQPPIRHVCSISPAP